MNAKLRRRVEALEEKSGSLLQEIQCGALPPKNRLPLILSAYLGTADLRFSACQRTLCPDGTLMEYVEIKGQKGDLAVATFPIELLNSGANKPVGNGFR